MRRGDTALLTTILAGGHSALHYCSRCPGIFGSPAHLHFLAVFLTMATSFLEFLLGTRAFPKVPAMVAWAMAAILLWVAGFVFPRIWG
ncbi:MAG: hypothetical protein M1499_08930 [Firmicutes bacterium]|nr:hypothetical protein [Bacillota bacterium]